MGLSAGTKLGPYEIVAPLGAGGMGEVYRARDTRLGREVAIKVLPSALAKDADRLQRFEQEARVLSALSHPNLLSIYDVGNEAGLQYLVSEYLEGQTLRERLQDGALPRRMRRESCTAI
jgi:serine/threonine protein kinase